MTRPFGFGWVVGPGTELLFGVRDGYRPYFENYTVDASILDNTYGVVTYN